MKFTFGHALAAALMTMAQAACAQPTTPPTTPPTTQAPGLGQTPNLERPSMPPPERGVIHPPADVDPEMRVLTPDPLPGRMPVLPPPANLPDRPRAEPR